jgi:hypothetical protein
MLHATSHRLQSDHCNNILWRKLDYEAPRYAVYLQTCVISCLFGLNISLNTLSSNTLIHNLKAADISTLCRCNYSWRSRDTESVQIADDAPYKNPRQSKRSAHGLQFCPERGYLCFPSLLIIQIIALKLSQFGNYILRWNICDFKNSINNSQNWRNRGNSGEGCEE